MMIIIIIMILMMMMMTGAARGWGWGGAGRLGRAVRSVAQNWVPGSFEVVFGPTMVTTQGAAWPPKILGKSYFPEIFDPGGGPPFVCPFAVPLHPLCSTLCIASPTGPGGQLSKSDVFGAAWGYFFIRSRKRLRRRSRRSRRKISPLRTKPKGEMFSSAGCNRTPIFRSKGSLARLDAFGGKVGFPGPHAFSCVAPAVATFVFYQ